MNRSHNVGTTCYEVEQILSSKGITMIHETVSARRTELRAGGYTTYLRDEEGNLMRRPTARGRNAYVEIATQLGKDTIRLGLEIRLNGRDPTAGFHGGNPMSSAAFKSANFQHCAREVLRVMVAYSP